jgi:hypothetical protein
MEILKLELPRTLEPNFYCPFSGHNLIGEGMNDAINDGYLFLAVNWEDADEYIAGDEDIMSKYQEFEFDSDMGDPTDRVEAFIKSIGKKDECFIIELTVNAMACGPITDCNTFVFWK